MEGYYQVLDYIARNTDSSLILFFVILAVLVVPLYGLLLRDRKYARKHEQDMHTRHVDRERVMLDVVKENSAAISECASVLSNTTQVVNRIHDRLDRVFDANAQ